ncbi:MAG: 7-carboxy-7-deazaguanine synthase QueE [Deltaproteobacteria bacterium]
MLLVSEIFASIQGETSYAGLPFSFVRLAGCNLRCRWCDTPYAWEGGEEFPLEEVVRRVSLFGIPRVTVTGGEPLLQPEAFSLVSTLADRGETVLVETNGTIPLAELDPRAVKIMDVKCPGSGESGRTVWENFAALSPRDEVKFVLASEEDYRYALEVLERHGGGREFGVLFSPAAGLLPPERLAGWMVGDRLNARFQLQLHKLVWGSDRRGV